MSRGCDGVIDWGWRAQYAGGMTGQRAKWILSLVVVPLIVTVVGGVTVFWLTEGRSQPPTGGGSGGSSPTGEPQNATTNPPQPLSLVERLAGEWLLVSWAEAGGPVTLYIEARAGNLTITENGEADWRLDIDEVGETHQPQPAIACVGRLNLGGQIEPVPRAEEIDWTADLRSANFSSTGEDRIKRALCGWATIGTRAPYDITTDGDETRPADTFEMRNEYGRFVWQRAE